ncbi:hypothetical protein [Staphylococcus pasteuri]|uniref:hypothetical protein n=1 Tax=Staphylococcus pasteuri TaxID=45972 RepID=UPI00249C619E|nr:hypothetical protein [Staphylococcus pasteuri]MDI3230984.1 hypothetical protein [Staphylococcus pasteuri]
MEYSKRTRQADTVLAIISVVSLVYTIYNITALTFGLKEDFKSFLIPLNILNNFLPLIGGSLLVGAYDMYVNTNEEDTRKQSIINAENSHQNKIKGMTIFTSAVIAILINLYKVTPIIIAVLIGLYLIVILLIVLKKFWDFVRERFCN